ncbi:methyl-accepting chemotaxis protein [Anaerosinus massiliensis]|uniref:methyl-accepting chemotaxis protein n=1 Tax=Massilibacillus massiliensis TaxID=1806837 RepID=UPI002D21B7EF|nr:methyl-accepting chemotaxis protein [Massilibacillus massiliensis]
MENIRVLTVAGGKAIAEELLAAIKPVMGKNMQGRACAFKEIGHDITEDLVVCVSSRIAETSQKVSSDKLVGVDMVPAGEFFVALAQVPAGQDVYVFNNSTSYAKQLVRYCEDMGIHHINFKLIPYDEISEREVTAALETAEYLVGIETIVGAGGYLTKYRHVLKSNVQLIVAKRVLNVEAACALMRWVSLFEYRQLAGNVQNSSNALSEQIHHISEVVAAVGQAFEEETASFRALNEKMNLGIEQLSQISGLSTILVDAAKNIGKIVDTIKHISSETNLLALNATIEAARVGELGRGFSVVAREVGKLAVESQKSTETIYRAVEEIQNSTQEIVQPLKDLSGSMTANKELFVKMATDSQKESQAIQGIFTALDHMKASSNHLVEVTRQLSEVK